MQDYNSLLSALGIDSGTVTLLTILAIWDLIWKGFALWKSSQKGEKIWFVIILAVNSAGILPILYYYWLNRYSLKKKV